MKDFFISSTDNKVIKCNETGSNCSLPVLIRLVQQQPNNLEFKKSESSFDSTIGYMNNQNMDFDFRCRHYSIDSNNETENFKWVLNKLNSWNEDLKMNTVPLFKKEDIFKKFFVLEIPDYGAQSMSPFFRDFVPHIYIDGLKLWQKYVGMIRHYSKRKAYILIDKGENNLKDEDLPLNNITNLEGKNIIIRICFKNRLERNLCDADKLEITSNDGKSFSGTTTNIFLHGSFKSESFNSYIGDYLFEVTKDETTKLLINPLFIEGLKFEKQSGSEINKQTGSYQYNNQNRLEIGGNSPQDYFSQHKRPYGASDDSDSKNIETTRETTVTITLTLKEKLLSDAKDASGNKIPFKTIRLIPKSNFYDAVYITGNDSATSYFGNDVNEATISVFKEDGSYEVYTGNNTSCEFIPEYTTTRKFLFTSENDSPKYEATTINNFKKDIAANFKNLYHWNLKKNLIYGYTSEGKLIPPEEEPTEGKKISNLVIYDTEIGDTINDSELSGGSISTNLKYICSTDALDKGNIEPGMFTFVFDGPTNNNQTLPDDDYDTETQQNRGIKKVYFDIKDNDDNNRCPLSFYMTRKCLTDSGKDIKHPEKYDFTIICRCFPIKYEKMTLDNYTTLFKIPDYFIHDENLVYINDDDYNPKLNTSFLNATERCLYMTGYDSTIGLNQNYKIYDINHMNKKLTEMDDSDNDTFPDQPRRYNETRLVNTNCINFEGKNEVVNNN